MTAIQLGRLACELTPGAGADGDTGARVKLIGRVDDSAPVGELLAHLPEAGAIAIDAGGVTFINSIGTREWVRLIRAIRARGQVLSLERIAEVMFLQMNLLPELRVVRIASFFAQYVCTSCGEETDQLIEVAKHRELLAVRELPKRTCAICAGVAETADFPERYTSIFVE